VKATPQVDNVELLRGGSVVSSFAGAFGSSLRETRLTAILGYLIALKPKVFCDEFGITGTIESVRLETRHDQDRSDILIKSTNGLAVIEAKTGLTDPFTQAMRYPAKWRVLLTQYSPAPNQKGVRRVFYRRWQAIADLIRKHPKEFASGQERFVSRDLIKYLEEHNMIPNEQQFEIYVRDINENESADVFLKGHLYCDYYKASSKIARARYFAPYFGRNVSFSHPGLQEGVSYVAKILLLRKIETFGDVARVARDARRETDFCGESDQIKKIKSWFNWKQNQAYNLFFLSRPRLAFNPTIKKKFIQKGTGWQVRHFYSFDEFYRAWGGEQIF
jgi:hypothetical protein